jgi:hypothetical protein
MNTVKNGKGSDPRPVDKSKYNQNYDSIDWTKHRIKDKAKVKELTPWERAQIAGEMSKL